MKGVLKVLLIALMASCTVIADYTPPLMTEEPLDEYGIEDQVLILRCRVTGNPPPSFIWKKGNKEISPGVHYSISSIGDLTIQKFNPNDDVGKYQCIARITDSTLVLTLLSRIADIKSPDFLSAFKSDLAPTTAYAGGATRLAVDATNFNPYPMIGWNYRGRPSITNSDPRFVVLPQGVLQINGLTSNDEGEIRAIARSRAASAKTAQTFMGQFAKLSVKSGNQRPSNKGFYFLGTPQDIDIQWGQTIILEALADSANSITYTWYKDGKRIQLNNDKSIFGKGNLKIRYAKDADSGTYKVVAESAGQKIEASANIVVMSSPQFTLIPPRRVYAETEGNARFEFKVVGSPKPTIDWYHDGVIVDASADYIEMGNGYLIVKDLIDADAGMYQARASNSIGDAQMSLELLILPPGITTSPGTTTTTPAAPLIPGKVRNVQAYAKSSTEITISWQEPSITNGAITGYELIYFNTLASAKKINIGGSNKFTTVGNLNPDTIYSFKLQAVNTNGPGPLSDVVQAKTSAMIALPGIVQNIQSSVTGVILSLSWTAPASGLPPTLYTVYYQNTAITGNPLNKDTIGTSTLVDNLTPGTTYKYYIVASATGVRGPKSQDFFVNVPKVTVVAPQAVTKLMVTPVFSNLVNLQWNMPKSGPRPDSYTVFYQNVDDSSAPLLSESRQVTTAVLQNLTPYANYEFYVIPYLKNVAGPKSAIKTLRMLEEVPPAINGLQYVSVGSSSLKVRWNPLSLTSFRGKLRNYKLSYYKQNQQLSTIKVIPTIPVTVNEWKIENLTPETNYVISVKGVSGSGDGKDSSTLTVKTRDITRQGPSAPADFQAVHHVDAPDFVMLTWSEPLFVTGTINSYVIYYRPTGTSNWISRTTPGIATGYNITNFQLGAQYETYIVAVDDNGEGKNSPVKSVTTMQENNYKPDPPRDLKLIPKADSLTASWLPSLATSKVIVRGYNVVVTNLKTGIEVFNGNLPGRLNTNIQLYNKIESETSYRAVVRTYNNYGTSSAIDRTAKTLVVLTPAITIKEVIPKATSIYFRWSDTMKSSNVMYDLRYKVFDVNGVAKTMTKTTVNTEIDVTDLTPYTTYEFFVKRNTDIVYQAGPTLESKTLGAVPSAPLDVTARGVLSYPTWLILSWQVPRFPNGKIQEYVILYTADEAIPHKDWPKINTKSISMTYNVTGLTAETKYFFVMYAVNGAGAGAKSVIYSTVTGGVIVPGGTLPSEKGGGGVIIVPSGNAHPHGGDGDLELWWILLIVILIILFILLILLLIYCCCCKKGGAACCWNCCPCCKKWWHCCWLPCFLCCCPCCFSKKKRSKHEKAYVAASATLIGGDEKAKNGNVTAAAPPDLWMTGKKDQIELMPLTAHADTDYLATPAHSQSGFGASSSQNTSKSSISKVKVPIPGDATFISYKTSLQDYCQKVGWLAPIYTTTQTQSGCMSKVSFGGSAYGSGDEFGSSKQDAEQRAAHAALIDLNVLDFGNKYANDTSIVVPSPGDASFISYKCTLHDFCQQCNILPPRFSTSNHESGYSSSVQVGSHTFNMSSRVRSTQEAEQKAACISLQGLCMMDSQSGYHPESCFTVPGPGDPNFVSFKSSLHDFCQRYKLPPPQYITNQGTQGFSAKLKFGGLFFQSSDYFQTRLEAEQHAAFEALQGLGLLESSVEFGAALESNYTAGPSGGVSLTHGSGIITVGHMGGSVSHSYAASRNASRTGSRSTSRPSSKPASRPESRNTSRPASRPSSRPGSRPGSRQGSMNQLNQSFNSSSATYATPQRDAQYSMGQRSHSSGSGFQGHSSSNINSSSSTAYSSTNAAHNTMGYSEGGFDSNYLSGALPKTSTLPHSRSKSYEQNHEIHQTGGGAGSSFSYSMSYEHRTATSSASSTLPRKPQQQMIGSSTSSQFVNTSTTRGYGSAQNVKSDIGYQSADTRSASHPALSELESEMAGLEGLIKDLNGITTSGKIA